MGHLPHRLVANPHQFANVNARQQRALSMVCGLLVTLGPLRPMAENMAATMTAPEHLERSVGAARGTG